MVLYSSLVGSMIHKLYKMSEVEKAVTLLVVYIC